MSENISGIQLSPRLKMIYDMLPPCCNIWDVGTDHALLPIYCVKTGKCACAIASDVRQKPLEAAKRNIAAFGCENKIKTVLSNGISACARYINEFDSVVIAGMGGYTVRSILSEGMEIIKKYFPGNISFILQPNTAENVVRSFVWENGFVIDDEMAVKDGSHVYAAFRCTYTGHNTDFSELECYTGKIIPKRLSDNDIVYLSALKSKYENITAGLLSRKKHDSESLERMKLSNRIAIELDRLISKKL